MTDEFMYLAGRISYPCMLAAKKLLTVPEASDYFSIGETKIRDMISEGKDGYYSLKNGNKFLIKKTRFCDYLMNSEAI